MIKYLLGLLSTLASLLFGTVVLADTGDLTLLSTSPSTTTETYSIDVLNLPLLQEANKTFIFNLAVSSTFSWTDKKATLTIDDCGKTLAMSYQNTIRMQVPLILTSNGKQEFPVTIYRENNNECILKFSLLDEDKKILTTKEVGILPQCPFLNTPIDQGLDYNLPELTTQQSTQTPISNNPSTSSNPSQNSQTPSQNTTSPSAPNPSSEQEAGEFLTYTDEELQSAFSLLVEKGLLTSADEARLQQPLTRIEVANLFVQIAVLNDFQKDDEKTCDFSDNVGLSSNEINIAKLACQYNIMGIHPDHTALANFMPHTIITSEQIVTAFSRLMWGDIYETPENEDHYFELHFNTMYNLNLVDSKLKKADQTLANFVIIASRAIRAEQLIINEISSETEKKSGFRFW